MATQAFEPMSVGQILDRAFKLYKQNFVRFVAIVAVVAVPVGLVQIAFQQVTFREVAATANGSYEISADDGPGPARVQVRQIGASNAGLLGAGIFGGLGLVFLAVLANNLSSGALMKSISESYLGNEVTVGQAYQYVLPRLGSMIWASILVGVVVVLGFLLLVVPGVIFSLWFALTVQIVVLERLAASKGMSRSRALTSGNLGKVFRNRSQIIFKQVTKLSGAMVVGAIHHALWTTRMSSFNA